MNWWILPFALLSGVLSGMGMGGGTVLIPVLTMLFGWEQHLAQWLNLVAFVPSAIGSLVIHARNKLLDGKAWACTLLPSLPTAIGFSFLAVKVEGRVLSLTFGCFLTLLGVVSLIMTIKKNREEKRMNTPREPADK